MSFSLTVYGLAGLEDTSILFYSRSQRWTNKRRPIYQTKPDCTDKCLYFWFQAIVGIFTSHAKLLYKITRFSPTPCKSEQGDDLLEKNRTFVRGTHIKGRHELFPKMTCPMGHPSLPQSQCFHRNEEHTHTTITCSLTREQSCLNSLHWKRCRNVK